MTKISEHTKLLHYLFTAALEGGVGYWSECNTYHWGTANRGLDRDPIEEDWEGFHADIDEVGDGYDDPVNHVIDLAVMRRGYALAISPEWRNRLAWSTGDKPPHVVTDHLEDWDYDAGDADMIVQLGLFENVVYG